MDRGLLQAHGKHVKRPVRPKIGQRDALDGLACFQRDPDRKEHGPMLLFAGLAIVIGHLDCDHRAEGQILHGVRCPIRKADPHALNGPISVGDVIIPEMAP